MMLHAIEAGTGDPPLVLLRAREGRQDNPASADDRRVAPLSNQILVAFSRLVRRIHECHQWIQGFRRIEVYH